MLTRTRQLVFLGGAALAAAVDPAWAEEGPKLGEANQLVELRTKNRSRVFSGRVTPGREVYQYLDDRALRAGESLPRIEGTARIRTVNTAIVSHTGQRIQGTELGVVKLTARSGRTREVKIRTTVSARQPLTLDGSAVARGGHP